MRAALAVIALALVVAPAEAGKKSTFKVGKGKPLKVGERVDVVEDSVADFSVVVDGKPVSMRHTSHEEYEYVVLVASGRRVDKIRIHYGRVFETTERDGKTNTEPDPRTQRAYIIERDGDALRVTYDDGSAVAAEEAKKVREENDDDVFDDAGIEDLVAGRTFRKGVALELSSDEAADLFDNDDGTLHGGRVTWRSTSAGIARFDVAISASEEIGAGILTIEFEGELELDAKKVRPRRASLHGTISGTGSVAGARGSVEATTTWTPRR